MTVTLIGTGCGGVQTMTLQGQKALEQSDYIIGAPRLLESLSLGDEVKRSSATRPENILALLQATTEQAPCVLYSGDTGFYSGAEKLLPMLKEHGFNVEVLPGISSLQYFAGKLGQSWQNWGIYSAHGRVCDPVYAVCGGRPAFFLTGGTAGVGQLCQELTKAGLGDLRVDVGENLSYEGERIQHGTASYFAQKEFAPLSVMLCEPAHRWQSRTPGIPDEQFLRDEVPMTKQEVRATVLAKLAIGSEDVCWDIGAGTGSVSVEMALQCRSVWAVERNPLACELICVNRKKFGAWNLHLVKGSAPDVLSKLPSPDAVFIGGSGRQLTEILQTVHQRNPAAKICITAIALETLHTGIEGLIQLGYETEIVQISVSRARKAGELHLLMGQNPIFLITGVPK